MTGHGECSKCGAPLDAAGNCTEGRPAVGRSVTCTVCHLRKQPRGRSAPAAMAGSLCDRDCPGYEQPPEPGDLWPGETREEFGY